MTLIFDNVNGTDNSGRAVSILTHNNMAVGSIMQLEDWGGFLSFKSIFTRTSLAQSTNHQFAQTLGERIYLHVFGDMIGMLELGGVAFYDSCQIAGNNQKMGITHVMEFFNKAKLSKRARPLRFTLDSSTVFEAYLHTFRGEASGTSGLSQRMFQFNLSLSIPPNTTAQGQLGL